MKERVSFDRAVLQAHLFRTLDRQSLTVMEGVLNKFMGAEQMLVVGCMPYERAGSRRCYRNGYERRWLESKWGSLKLRVPKVRNAAEPFRTAVFDRYHRYQRELEEAIQTWVAFGMSTRKVAATVRQVFGATVSPATVGRVIAELDKELAAFHRRSLKKGYRYLFLDGKWGCIRRCRGKAKRGKKQAGVLLVAWGIDHRGREELVDFRVARAEDEASWTAFLTDLEARGLRAENPWAERLEMIISDDAGGLEAALAMVYPTVPRQLCVFHKLRNIAGHLIDRRNRKRILAEAAEIYRDSLSVPQAQARLARWKGRWQELEPRAVAAFNADFDQTLTYLSAPGQWRSRLVTNNPVERFLEELNRRFNMMGSFANAQSWERATYLMWKHLKLAGYPNMSKNDFTRKS